MPKSKTAALILENRLLRVEIDGRDLATHVIVKQTGETLRMAGAQPDDVQMVKGGVSEWKSFASGAIRLKKAGENRVEALLPALCLKVSIALDADWVLYEVAPQGVSDYLSPRDVLYPRHFLIPRRADAYATFPLAQGSIIPATQTDLFHHREGYSEAHAHWLGGFTGKTGYVGIPETPDDLYQAVDHRSDSPASVFFHWCGSLGRLAYARKARFHFAADLDYVRQAKCYRSWCKKIGLFVSLAEKARKNPNVAQLCGAPIICALACIRRERQMQYEITPFKVLAERIETFRKKTGIRRGVVHTDGWGYWGYDAMHPDTIPPNPDCGGAEGLSELARRAKACGYLFGLHDQYIDAFAHAPSYNEKNSVVTEDGRPIRLNRWAGGLSSHTCYTRLLPYLRRNLYEGVHRVYPMYHNSPSVWKICRPTAYYLDCHLRTVECWSKEHPMTRGESRRIQNEMLKLTRNGREGQGIVLSVEHPRDFSVPYLDFGWSIGHFSADVTILGGDSVFKPVGIPVPLWHLVFHDALCLPEPHGAPIQALLYAQAPYFNLDKGLPSAKKVALKKIQLALHEDAGFAEMTGHKILSTDGSVQRCTYAGGIEVEADKAKNTYRISGGKAKTKGMVKLPVMK